MIIILRNIELFKGIDLEDIEEIENDLIIKEYNAGQEIYSPLDKCIGLNILIDGTVKLCKFSSEGHEKIISIINAGGVFGEALVFEYSNYPVHVVCEKSCRIGVLSKENLLKITKFNETFTLNYFSELSKKIQILNERLEYLTIPKIKGRIAKYLYDQSIKQNSQIIKQKISKQKLAYMLGTSREVISRNYKIMEKDRCFEYQNKMLKLNMNKLQELF